MNGYIHMERNTGDSQGLCGINMLASYPTKTSPNPPPPSPPSPVKCNLFTYCSQGETCCCARSFFGICFSYKCCGLDSAVCCKDNRHCCPQDYPVCDTKRGQCLKVCINCLLAFMHFTCIFFLFFALLDFIFPYRGLPMWREQGHVILKALSKSKRVGNLIEEFIFFTSSIL